jgi:hypothetical protein
VPKVQVKVKSQQRRETRGCGKEVRNMKSSPYAKYGRRLQDVIAAIQVMSTHSSDSSTIASWTERIGKPVSVNTGTWLDVFKDHPEFFHLEEWSDPKNSQVRTLACLTWRRANEKTYDAMKDVELTIEEAAMRDRTTLNRKPLTAEQVGILLKSAVELDTRANAFQERKEKLLTAGITVIATLMTTVVGVILGAILKSR